MSSKTNKFQQQQNTEAQAKTAEQAKAESVKAAEECQKEVMQVLERRGFRMVVVQQMIDGQLVPLQNIPLRIAFVPNEIAGA